MIPVTRPDGRTQCGRPRLPARPFASSRVCFGALGVALLTICAGCGYMVGNTRAPEIRTVHVPAFTSDSFRRGFELQLTEAVQEQVQLRGFRLAKPPTADTRLVGHIVSVEKRPVNQNKFDDPRELEVALAVKVRWEDARTGQLLNETEFPIDPLGAHAVTQATIAPETGQSLATGTQEAVDRLARQIVGMMEIPW